MMGPVTLNPPLGLSSSDPCRSCKCPSRVTQGPWLNPNPLSPAGVPLIFSNPVLWPKGVESESLVSHVDLLPTLMDFFNITSQRKMKLPGKSYKRILMDPKAEIQQVWTGPRTRQA